MAIEGRQIAVGGGVTAVVALAFFLITGFEDPHGQPVLQVYPDPVTHGAPWTYCDGETAHPKWNHVYTVIECNAETLGLIEHYDLQIRACMQLAAPLPPKTEAAFVTLSWNIGTGAFCKSSVAAFAHDGKLVEACNRIPQYNRAGGKPIPGLTMRRGEERKVCLQGVAAAHD